MIRTRTPMVIGWREHVALPLLGVARVLAKIDTGARTSALHATQIVPFMRDGHPWVRFRIPRHGDLPATRCESPLVEESRHITNTSGVPEARHVIETQLVMGRRRWRIEVSLTDRSSMKTPLILGRTAIRRHSVLVDAGRSCLVGPPRPAKPRKVKQ